MSRNTCLTKERDIAVWEASVMSRCINFSPSTLENGVCRIHSIVRYKLVLCILERISQEPVYSRTKPETSVISFALILW